MPAIQYFGYQSYNNQTLPQWPFNNYGSYNLFWPWFSYLQATDVIDYYVNLLIMQYHNKPKAQNTIFALVEPVVMNLLPQQVMNGYDIGTASGVQLDVLGEYTGVTRTGVGPNGQITLDDSDFTRFIQLAIVNNSNNSTLFAIQELLHTYFDQEIIVFDHMNMRMSYFVASDSVDSDLATLFVVEGKLPKPLGVQLSSVIYAPYAELISFFGCRTYTQPGYHISPLNTYGSYNLMYPFLSYTNALL